MRKKTRVTKSWLVLVLHLIDCESGASFLDQSQSELSKYNYYSNLLAAGLNHTDTCNFNLKRFPEKLAQFSTSK